MLFRGGLFPPRCSCLFVPYTPRTPPYTSPLLGEKAGPSFKGNRRTKLTERRFLRSTCGSEVDLPDMCGSAAAAPPAAGGVALEGYANLGTNDDNPIS